ncbi:GspH/FimT family pseudopilin [Photobacterium leiognathi]|uniref:General secretion pathway GspH domain-containing protein n=1 Tax=Photobacterium leiognathi TaxID=553611 RepID=A0ABX5GAY5_PHOLE|nr:hypothetical protein [Photobacterium leiognathi]KJF86563.1 hypothetical protein UB42_18775 [Photobacterium leiognathi]PSV78209.1 hypothetical protein CTM94_19560 [Photobacterium leiognathi]
MAYRLTLVKTERISPPNIQSLELRGLIVAAKSEAVMRGTDVYLHTIGLTSTKTLTDNWCLIATTDATITDCDHSTNLNQIVLIANNF